MKKVLISSCLLGEKVRYDAGHCQIDQNLLEKLKNQYDLKPICPEVLAGMGVPRKPIELKGNLIINEVGEDLTELFTPVKSQIKEIVENFNISYAILKDFSPSCGSTEVYDGSFTGKKVEGEGIVARFLLDLGVEVYNEQNFVNLLS